MRTAKDLGTYDLEMALEYNPIEGVVYSDDLEVLALIEGENDEANWFWVLLINGVKVLLDGWCDYTGWDCQSGVKAFWQAEGQSDEDFIAQAFPFDSGENDGDDEWRIDWTAKYNKAQQENRDEILRQLKEGAKDSWRIEAEGKLKEVGGDLPPMITI